jgi:hypothetical protein
VAAMSSGTTRLWVWNETWTIPPVPLTRDLPREGAAISAAFDTRVKARFPIGTPVAVMALELQREKFIRQDWSGLPGQEHYAEHYDGGAPICNLIARVYWKSDEDDRLTAIRRNYEVTSL